MVQSAHDMATVQAKIEQQMREKGIDENTEVRNIDTNMATVKVIEREGYIIVE